MPVRFLPVAHPAHPLHQLGRDVSMRDLRQHRHFLVRDTGSLRERAASGKRRGTVETRRRWTVTNMATSIGAVCRGYGFAWLPTDKIRAELATGELAPLPLRDGRERIEQLYLIFGDSESAGPGTRRLAEILKSRVDDRCAGESAPEAGMGRGLLQDV
jgi:DNA-binding transcriptional LysR family regulator